MPEWADYWIGKVESIRRFASRDKDARAPYKPLHLLWLIGRLAGGLPSRVSFSEAELDLKLLMHRHRLGRSVRVGFPFVYLATSQELWRGGGLERQRCCQDASRIKRQPDSLLESSQALSDTRPTSAGR